MRFRWNNVLRACQSAFCRARVGQPRPAVKSSRRLRSESLEPRLPLAGDLVVTELHYNPLPPGAGSVAADNTDFEFIEIQNVGATARPMQGVNFSDGIAFTFPESSLAPGERAVVVRNAAAFGERYGQAIPIAGVFTGTLSDRGETITLRDANNAILQSFSYSDQWAPASDGPGHSLVVRDANQSPASWTVPNGWRASSRIGGSPGAEDIGLFPGAVVVNELLSHEDGPPGDWVELHNTSAMPIDLGGWYLSDKPNQPLLYRIPDGVTIAAGGYLTLTQNFHFGVGPNAFALSEFGEQVLLTAPAGPGGENYGDYVEFAAVDTNVSLGRYVASTGGVDFPATMQPTRNAPNAPPAVGPIVISEIMYNPDVGEDFIELHNPTSQTIPLFDPVRPTNTWRFTQGISFAFPTNVILPPGGYLLLVDDNPANFRAANSVPASVPIYSFTGVSPDATLSNSGEMLELSRPGKPEPPESPLAGFVPYYAVDRVRYDENAPWPAAPDGNGPSLVRKTQLAFGNDVVNWQAGPNGGSPGRGDADLVGPRVTSVRVGGATWTGDPIEIPVGDPTQLLPLPLASVDRITLTFDEPVTATATALSLGGVNVADYPLVPSVPPGVASQSITWSLAAPIAADRLLLDLENEQTLDVAGNRLDGDWIDAASVFPSGDGASGTDFLFSFAVLPGDVNQSGTVTQADFAAALQHVFASSGAAEFDALCDVDANGIINVVDLIRIRNAFSTSLPAGAPSPSASPAAPAAIVASAAPSPTTAAVGKRRMLRGSQVDATFALSQDRGDPDPAPPSKAIRKVTRSRRIELGSDTRAVSVASLGGP